MILSWLRFTLMGLVFLTLVYWLISFYARSVRREELEQEWEAGDHGMEREEFVEAGLAEYSHSLRRRLILLVYVLPAIAVPTVAYFLNFG